MGLSIDSAKQDDVSRKSVSLPSLCDGDRAVCYLLARSQLSAEVGSVGASHSLAGKLAVL